jgi:hypothetical protein
MDMEYTPMNLTNVAEVLKPSPTITGFLQYHMRGGRKRGVICAQYNHETKMFRVGWSLCAMSRGDSFDVVHGREMALGRMTRRQGWNSFTWDSVDELFNVIPDSMHKDVGEVILRINKIHDSSKPRMRPEDNSIGLAPEALDDSNMPIGEPIGHPEPTQAMLVCRDASHWETEVDDGKRRAGGSDTLGYIE